jgi:acyl-CoA synthetase (NDP forming)
MPSQVLNPRSIALVGASEDNFYARSVVENLNSYGFDGALSMVNPTRQRAFGQLCANSLTELDAVDMVVVAVNRGRVEEVVDASASVGAKGAIILAAGFRDGGDVEWAEVERRIAGRATQAGMLIAGPNCLGVVALPKGAAMYAAPLPWQLPLGRVALIIQSGGLLPGTCHYLTELGVGLRYAISSGNASCTTISRWVEELNRDPDVSAIGVVAEAIDDWPRFRAAVEQAHAAGRYVVVCKLGRSRIGQAAAYTHTGALAGDHAALHGALAQLGVPEARTIGELVVAVALADRVGQPQGRGLGIMSHSGGAIGQLADLSQERGIALPQPDSATAAIVEDCGRFFKGTNPIDISKQAMEDLDAFSASVRAFVRDRNFATVLYVSGADIPDGTIPVNFEQLRRVAAAADEEGRLVIVSRLTYSPLGQPTLDLVAAHKHVMIVPVLDDALGGVLSWMGQRMEASPEPVSLSHASGGDAQWRNEHDLKTDLAAQGIRVPLSQFFASPVEAAHIVAIELTPPFVVKTVGRLIHHKTRLGLLELNLRHPDEVRASVERMQQVAASHGLPVDGYLIEEMVAGTVDIIVSCSASPLGDLLLVGCGGVDVETSGARAFAVLPVSDTWIEAMLKDIGVVDTGVIERGLGIVRSLVDYYLSRPLDTLECNPVRLDMPDGPCVLDALAMARPSESVSNPPPRSSDA